MDVIAVEIEFLVMIYPEREKIEIEIYPEK